jgi:hypothetical protein
MTYVAISQARQRELAGLLSRREEDIRVISPPLDAADWLAVGAQAQQIV